MVEIANSKADILVLGGGTSGVCAAIEAARSGASVRLIERNAFLGGSLTASMVGGLCGMFGAKKTPHDEPEQIVFGVGEEIRRALDKIGGLSGINRSPMFHTYRYDPFLLQIALDGLIEKYGVSACLYTEIIDADMKDGSVSMIETHSKSGRERIFPKFVIDATGDADIVHMTGGRYRKNVSELQAGSLNFRMSGVNGDGYVPNIPELMEIMAGETEYMFKNARSDPMFINSPDMHQVICCFSRLIVDGSDAGSLTSATVEGRRQILPTVEFIKKRFPAFSDARLSGIASYIGVRETRVIEGETELTREDVLGGRRHPQSVGRCAWPVERHIDGQEKSEIVPLKDGEFYDVPFGVMIPRGYKNLLVTGRSVSSDWGANASVRVFGPCSVTGMAAGAAGAVFIKNALGSVSEIDIGELRMLLSSHGALL